MLQLSSIIKAAGPTDSASATLQSRYDVTEEQTAVLTDEQDLYKLQFQLQQQLKAGT